MLKSIQILLVFLCGMETAINIPALRVIYVGGDIYKIIIAIVVSIVIAINIEKNII